MELEIASLWSIDHIWMIFHLSLTFDCCTGPLAWFPWISKEQTLIMGCLWLIFSLPDVVHSDSFTPRSLIQAFHFILKCLCDKNKHWGSMGIENIECTAAGYNYYKTQIEDTYLQVALKYGLYVV